MAVKEATATLVLYVVYFEPPVKPSTIQDLQFPVPSRTLSFHFQDFPGPNCFPGLSRARKIQEKNSGLPRMRGNPDIRPGPQKRFGEHRIRSLQARCPNIKAPKHTQNKHDLKKIG